MRLSYPSRLLPVLRACLLLLAVFATVRWWHISSSHAREQQKWASKFKGNIPEDPLAHLDEISTATKSGGESDQLGSTRAQHSNSNNEAGYPPIQHAVAAGDDDDEDIVSSSSKNSTVGDLPLPAEYAAHDPTSDFCAARFTTKWFDVMRANHNQYCLDSAASALHCFHTPPDFHSDGHVDSFCIGQNAMFDMRRDKFTLDCPVTKVVAPGLPKTPWDLHEYWYETGPRPIFWRWMTLDDRAEILQHKPFKGPPGFEETALLHQETTGHHSPQQQQQQDQQPDRPGMPTERDLVVPHATTPPRTFTYLLKREGSGNIFHSLHEIMSMTQTFDALRTTRDPTTNAPFFVPDDVAQVQIVIIDGHNDGPYFDLWKLFSGREPRRITQLVSGDGKEAQLLTTSDDSGGTPWLSRPLDNVIIPLAGASNPVWHDDWEKWDCVNELRTVFVRRVLDFYGFSPDAPVAKKQDEVVRGGRSIAKREAPSGSSMDEKPASPKKPSSGSTSGSSSESGSGSGGSPAAKAAAAVKSSKTNSPPSNDASHGGDIPKGSTKEAAAAAVASKNETATDTEHQAIKNEKPAMDREGNSTKDNESAHRGSSSSEDNSADKHEAPSTEEKPMADKHPPSSTSSHLSTSNTNSISNADAGDIDDDASAPPPPGALRITFIDRKETRRVQDTPALLAHARDALARLHLNVHIQAVDFATLSFREQIALARETDVLVGVHGAGLTHTLFMRQDMGALVEIFPEGFELRCFRAMARDRGLGYYKMHVPVVEKKEDFHVEDVIVAKEKFVEVLEHAVKALDNRPGSFNDFY
ncbi:glycosyltransferase 61 family protein [Microdochium nivale]|nr:glycosyltransferase 61 family protein [Microdochium nivale]